MIRYLLPIFLLFLLGCDDTATPKNNPPIAKITISALTLNIGENLSLSASTSSDSDGNIVAYEWIENNHLFSNESNTSWTAPSIAGNYILSLKVTDDDGATDNLDIMIVVNASQNQAPTAIIMEHSPIFLGDTITLDGSQSTDSDGNITTYAWSTSDNQTFSTKVATWTPSNANDYTATLTVTDNNGASSQQSITINVSAATPAREIFLIGDSTVAVDNPPKVGWGLKFGAYMKNPDDYYNVAVGGASSRSYKLTDTIDWNKTKQLIQDTDTSEGAYLMVHLGLNDIAQTVEDAEDNSTKTTMPGRYNSYYYELKEYTDWAKANDIIPVLIVPVENMKKYTIDSPMEHVFSRPYGNYAQTVRQLANDENVLLLDLEEKSYTVFNGYDPDALITDFSSGFDESDGIIDRVHFNDNGADIVARWVKELACSSGDTILCAQFR